MRRALLLLALLTLTTAAAWRRGDAYMLHAGETDVTMSNQTVRELLALRRRLGDGPYLWVRLGGREYLIRDEAVLREAVALWAPIETMKPEERALSDEEEKLDDRIDAIEDGRAKAEPGELERLRTRNDDVSRRQHQIEQREETIEKEVEAKLRDLIDKAIRGGRARELR